MVRMWPLAESSTVMVLSLGSNLMSVGWSKVAALASPPSPVLVHCPWVPATVAMTPSVFTRRMTQF